MTKETGKPCLADLGGIFQLFGGVLVLGAQVAIYFALIPFFALIPSVPIDIRPLYELIGQMLLIILVVMVLCGIVIVIAGIVSFFRSSTIGGFLSLFFGIPVIVAGVWMVFGVGFYPGLAHFAGAVLAMVGGVLSIIPAIRRPPQPKTRREKDIVARQKRKK
jgi:hypothetical protein